jgi:putative transcriptional regulator
LAAEGNLKNQFLLAMPGLTGSYFGGTITYVCEHNEDGAMGLLVNRPTTVSLVELLAQLGIDTSQTSVDIPVLEGGPVATERGFVLHGTEGSEGALDADAFASSLDLGNGLMLSTARDVLEAISRGAGPREYLVALGYAGWGEGQLEQELAENAWLTCPADPQVLFHCPFEDRVNRAAASLGIDFRLLSGQAGHA